ncbi:MAG: helix-turn-helix domain-containing protein [Gammaproteobacteria bacterium]
MNLKTIEKKWAAFQAATDIGPIRDDAHYDRIKALADALIDSRMAAVGAPLEGLFVILCDLIEDYDRVHYPGPTVTPREMLRFLMERHGLTQSELPEIGNQSVVSQVLSGTRGLNARQIAGLTARFDVPADVFLDVLHDG